MLGPGVLGTGREMCPSLRREKLNLEKKQKKFPSEKGKENIPDLQTTRQRLVEGEEGGL